MFATGIDLPLPMPVYSLNPSPGELLLLNLPSLICFSSSLPKCFNFSSNLPVGDPPPRPDLLLPWSIPFSLLENSTPSSSFPDDDRITSASLALPGLVMLRNFLFALVEGIHQAFTGWLQYEPSYISPWIVSIRLITGSGRPVFRLEPRRFCS